MEMNADDEFYVIRAADNQVKTVATRNADRQGHKTDAIADALFSKTLAVLFGRIEEENTKSVKKLLDKPLETWEEQSLVGSILTPDRVFGKESTLGVLMKFVFCSLFAIPEHFLRFYPFAGKYYFIPYQKDLQVESETYRDVLRLHVDESDNDIEARARVGAGVTN